MNNQGRQPGIGKPRRFVPPTKDGAGGGGGAANASFHPGRSFQQHMAGGNNAGGDGNKSEGDKPLEEMDERYKNLDPRVR